jgi:hypothetical protein
MSQEEIQSYQDQVQKFQQTRLQDLRVTEKELLDSFMESQLNSRSYAVDKPKEDYNSSEYRTRKYRDLASEDALFNTYLKMTYGSVSSFFDFNQQLTEARTFDPSTDYNVDVVVITEDTFYVSNSISSVETFLEILGGVCSIEFIRVDGRADKIIGTLQSTYIPSSQEKTRRDAFGSLGSRRILVWDILKQGWSSFYMQNLRRFVRDDTSGIQ